MIREIVIDGNKAILDTDFYLYLLKCEDEQKKIVSFLNDKVKEIENTQEIIINENEVILTSKKEKLDLLNEVLDFVNKGGKNETK